MTHPRIRIAPGLLAVLLGFPSPGTAGESTAATRSLWAAVATPCGSFVDVDANDPFCPWILSAEAAGRMDACASDPDPRFCPTNAVTRQQLALALQAAAVQDVLVTNTAAEPVPVSLQGTTPVSMASPPPIVTQLVLAERYYPTQAPPCNGSVACMTIESPAIDVEDYGWVRITARIACDAPFTCTANAAQIIVSAVSEISDLGSNTTPPALEIQVLNGTVLSAAYPTPGRGIEVRAFCNPGPCGFFDLQIAGRPN